MVAKVRTTTTRVKRVPAVKVEAQGTEDPHTDTAISRLN